MNFNLSLLPQANYHVKIVILDAVSGGWSGVDSGVFIKKTNISTSADLDFNWSSSVNNTLGVTVSFTPSYIDLDNVYYWDFNNDGLTDSNEINPVFVFNQPGDYIVSLQVYNECSGMTESVSYELDLNIINDVHLIEASENIISVFPNPANQFVSITLQHCIHSAVIELIDMSGKVLYNKKTENRNSYTIDVSAIEPGPYYLQVNCLDTQDTYYEKIMIL